MTDKGKAEKLAEEYENATSFGIESPYHAALGAAISMAYWKNQQFLEKSKKWFEENGIDSEYFERFKQDIME